MTKSDFLFINSCISVNDIVDVSGTRNKTKKNDIIEKKAKTKNAKSVPNATVIFGNRFAIVNAMSEHKMVTKADPAAFTFTGNSSPASAHGILANPETKI